MRFSKRQRTLGRARHPWSTLAWTAYGIRWLPAVYTRCWRKTAKGLLGGPRTSSICKRSAQSTVWLLGPSTTAATVRLRRVIPDPTTLLTCPFCHNTTLQDERLQSVTTNVTSRSSKKRVLCLHQRPTRTWLWPGGCEGGGYKSSHQIQY